MIWDLKSVIEKVIVYRSGAFISRSARIHLQPGRHRLNLIGLSKQIIENSIQISMSAGLSCSQVTFCADVSKAAAQNITKEQKEKLQQLKKRRDLVETRMQIHIAEYNALNKQIIPSL